MGGNSLEIFSQLRQVSRRRWRLLLGALILLLVAALLLSVQHAALRKRQSDGASPEGRRPLPEDVESVVKSFSYSQMEEGVKVRISGTRVVRRGRRILGLRSNLVKTNFIQGLTGSVESGGRRTGFSASDAEWDADPAHPLLLNKDVTVSLDGRLPLAVQNARIYLNRWVMEVDNGSKSYRLK